MAAARQCDECHGFGSDDARWLTLSKPSALVGERKVPWDFCSWRCLFAFTDKRVSDREALESRTGVATFAQMIESGTQNP